MAIGIHGTTPAPHPNTKQLHTLTVDGTGGNYKLKIAYGTKSTANATTATIAHNANAAAVKSAIETAVPGIVATVTGGPGGSGGGTPYVISFSKGPFGLSVVDAAVTGGGATVTLVAGEAAYNHAVNETVVNPTNATRVAQGTNPTRLSHPWAGTNPTYPFSG